MTVGGKTTGEKMKKACLIIVTVLFYAVTTILLFLGVVGHSLTDWYKETFQTNFRELIYTFGLGLKGADAGFMKDAVPYCGKWLALFFVMMALIVVIEVFLHRRKMKKARLLFRVGLLVVALLLAYSTYDYADKAMKVRQFVKTRLQYTDIYDKEYVDPRKVEITAPEKKRNIIVVYLESMETTYASKALGGFQKDNYMPNLTRIQKENIGFGDRKEGMVRGTHNPYGTGWTTGAILASSTGVPFAFHVGMNQMGKEETFAAGLFGIGDFLKKEGYNQEFLCGSDSEFGGRKKFFEDHGDYDIFDYNTAKEKDYIAKDYEVWWGLEDHKLYEIAKDELTRISSEDKPFNFTMLTVDTHHVGGYKCKWCPDTYPKNKTATVVACADAQINEFLEWCMEQDFYENTTIAIIGDHPRMDKILVKGVPFYKREAYNCFINTAYSDDDLEEVNNNRIGVTMDLYPTLLSSMGYKIKGEKLGLGTNLFSNEKTIAEKLTYKYLNGELEKNSRYYQKNFP